MSKELSEITKRVIGRINEGNIKMRPRMYFVLGSVLTICGLIASIVTSVFFVGLMRFAIRARGPMSDYRLNRLLSDFPWWMLLVAFLGLIVGIWLLRRYDFSYKADFKALVVGLILAVLVSGWVIDVAGINDALSRKGFMRGFHQQSGIDVPFRGR
jgi:hypothetical protein